MSDLFHFNSSHREEREQEVEENQKERPDRCLCSYRIAYSITDPNMGNADRLSGRRRLWRMLPSP